MIAMQDEDLSELVVHNPPLNLLTIFLLPVVPFRGALNSLAGFFSRFIFWIENIFYIGAFLCYELFMFLPIFFVSYVNIFN